MTEGSNRLYPQTPDGRYFVVRGRLWRMSDPAIDGERRFQMVRELMQARRAVRGAKGDPVRLAQAHAAVDGAKRELGERGPVWWTDGEPDYGRKMAKNTPYADWFASLPADPAR